MKDIKVLGCCASKCDVTAKVIEEVAKSKGVEIKVEKITDLKRIATLGVMSTPGVVVDGRIVHSGSVPARGTVAGWLARKQA
jgi:small redox-active disulfide protein 2